MKERRWWAEQNKELMGRLRGKPRALWAAYIRDDGAAADAGASLDTLPGNMA
jgi:hypothetical protein